VLGLRGNGISKAGLDRLADALMSDFEEARLIQGYSGGGGGDSSSGGGDSSSGGVGSVAVYDPAARAMTRRQWQLSEVQLEELLVQVEWAIYRLESASAGTEGEVRVGY
jgi:hypothetical protein